MAVSQTQSQSLNMGDNYSALMNRKINVGTRNSALAMIQAEIVHTALQRVYPELQFEIHGMTTTGDKDQVTALSKIGAKALWTSELEDELREGKLDMIVHSLKDMPTTLPENLKIGCILEREDPRDVLIMRMGSSYKSLSELPDGAVVGTSSLRRCAQVKRYYPQLVIKNVRGNVGTRLNKLDAEDGEYSCLILAAAGIKRMGWGDRITSYFDSKTDKSHFYAVGQGAMAIEIKEGDDKIQDLISILTDKESTLATTSERSLMRTLEGGCSVPIGVESTWIEKEKLMIKAIVISLDGTKSVEVEKLGQILDLNDAEEFGKMIAHDLIENGAGKILEEVKKSMNSNATLES
ncbi:Porphobilinogen deaminase [Erysiphe neolycopersici]|uniref:Porphobilinogen deaminase n=1 Tax=Erysiphe neolycopersici TaxID=212602 RepID=A0A420HR58_9PEZI|nr:Porphobilinogen deaminase [Erysiphe neolycopersici]